MRRFAVGGLFLFLTLALQAQVKYSNEFLNIGVGARTLGMGGAGIAAIHDASAGYWNPGGLALMQTKYDASLMHAEYFAGLAKYDYGALAYKIDQKSAASVSFIRMGVDDIPNTLELIDEDGNIRYDRIKRFSAADMGILLSYSRLTPIEGLTLGGSAKIIYRRTGDFASALGFGFDLGANYERGSWLFGAVVRDLTTTFNAWRFQTEELEEVFKLTGNEIPENSLELTLPRIIIGVSKEFILSENLSTSVHADIHFNTDGRRAVLLPLGFTGVDPYVGSEWNYRNWLFVRVGAGQFQWITGWDGENDLSLQPALGLGVKFKELYIDYALTDLGDLGLAQYSNIISLRMGLGQ